MKISTRNYIGLAIVFLPLAIIWLSHHLDWELARGDRAAVGIVVGLVLASLYRIGQKRVTREDWRKRHW